MTTPRRHLSRTARIDLFRCHGGLCSLCGGKIDGAREAWEIEHEIPLSMGGADDASNWTIVHAKCHHAKTRDDMANLGQARRREAKHIGAKPPSRTPLPCGRSSPWKKRINGTVERRHP